MVVPPDAFPPQAADMERRCSKCSGEGIGRMRVGADSQSVAQQAAQGRHTAGIKNRKEMRE